ncbi:MAG: Trm112 family protein [Proteobacteria bacterium]|nr:Trm112 family protein [Pseudomonadota bacterium]
MAARPLEDAVRSEVRALLVCPKCRGELHDLPEGLVCRPCKRLYPVVRGVPRLVLEEAVKLK